jgi:hypothetical protein
VAFALTLTLTLALTLAFALAFALAHALTQPLAFAGSHALAVARSARLTGNTPASPLFGSFQPRAFLGGDRAIGLFLKQLGQEFLCDCAVRGALFGSQRSAVTRFMAEGTGRGGLLGGEHHG